MGGYSERKEGGNGVELFTLVIVGKKKMIFILWGGKCNCGEWCPHPTH